MSLTEAFIAISALLYAIVANGCNSINVDTPDNSDYLARDSHYCNVRVSCDLNRLQCLTEMCEQRSKCLAISALLYAVVANGHDSIDVDKFDYLTRDSHYSSVRVSCDLDRPQRQNKVSTMTAEMSCGTLHSCA